MSKIECKNVVWIPKSATHPDVHVIYLTLHQEDGAMTSSMKIVKDYKRPFYVTAKGHRDHTQKKEREHISKLTEFVSTQSELRNQVAIALNQRHFRGGLPDLGNSPYLYGTKRTSTSLIKEAYANRQPDLFTPYKVGMYDIETDVVSKGEDAGRVIVASTSVGDEVHVSVLSDFIKGIESPMEKLEAMARLHIPELYQAGGSIVFDIVESEVEVIKHSVGALHASKCDIAGVWNLGFDIPIILTRLSHLEVDPVTIFTDPEVPIELGNVYFHERFNKDAIIQWSSFDTVSRHVWLDAMAVFRITRSQEPKRSLALDSVLTDYLGRGKLKIVDDDQGRVKLAWHMWMQEEHPLEYVIYNIFDTYGMVLLDRKTRDLTTKLPMAMKYTPFKFFPTRTTRADDMYYFFNKPLGYITATPPRDQPENKVLPLVNWIVSAPAHLMVDNGLCLDPKLPHTRSGVRLMCFDVDLTSSYPSLLDALNNSKDMTKTEVMEVRTNAPFKEHNIALLHGRTNAIHYCCEMYGLPTIESVLMKKLADQSG